MASVIKWCFYVCGGGLMILLPFVEKNRAGDPTLDLTVPWLTVLISFAGAGIIQAIQDIPKNARKAAEARKNGDK